MGDMLVADMTTIDIVAITQELLAQALGGIPADDELALGTDQLRTTGFRNVVTFLISTSVRLRT